jgi:hypothetical protein
MEIWVSKLLKSVRVRTIRERKLQGPTIEAKSCGGDARYPMSPPGTAPIGGRAPAPAFVSPESPRTRGVAPEVGGR